MHYLQQTRPVESPYLESITELRFTAAGETLMQPDGCWDIAILKRGDDVQVLRTGLTTRAVAYEHSPGDETLVISFKPSAFMPLMPGEVMRDEGVLLEKFGRGNFWIGTDVREIPNFENADVFVEHLVRQEIVQSNDVVASVLEGQPKAMSERTMQRHFLRTTGLTYKSFTLIERAQKAMSLLRMGRPAADVAFALGYADQAHMINSLRTIMGQTPGQIARAAAT
jgi:Helix-turn-helix domain